MPRLILTRTAIAGLNRCRLFLDRSDEAAARRAAEAIDRHLGRLTTSPEIGRSLPPPSMLRELVIPFGRSGYLALYRHEPKQDAVYVLAFRH